MITYLHGTLISKTLSGPQGCYVVLEINGIGYRVFTNKRVINSIGEINDKVKLFTSLIHKEDSMTLCGFLNHEDRDLFNILQSVSGIGVKVAMLLLENMTSHELIEALVLADSKRISQTKGVGPKLAQRIVLELKDKMTNWRNQLDDVIDLKVDMAKKISENAIEEAKSILLSLGYTNDEIKKGLQSAIANAEKQDNFEELIKLALQSIASD